MKKPVLVIMAAGMGSRYGGLKQIDPVDGQGHIIMDFSIYDAKRAGFEKVVFIIKKENEKDFREAIGRRIEGAMDVAYAYQDLSDIPDGFAVPPQRVKPWGTAHAVLSARHEIDGPFVVNNADDYYGREAFQKIYDYLMSHEDDDKYRYAMAGYRLGNTLTENGRVARGICEIDDEGGLASVTERTRIEQKEQGPAYTEDDGASWTQLPADTVVSMNLWGFTAGFLKEIEQGFAAFLEQGLRENPLKCEYFLPAVVSRLLAQEKATVAVLTTEDKWYGVTYKEDKPVVEQAVRAFCESGLYPQKLWGDES